MGSFNKKETDEQMLKRLAGHAGNIIDLLKHVFTTEKGLDIKFPLLYAAGLAGYACHQATKAKGGSLIKITTKDGKNFYYGDGINKYLLESHTSIYSFCNAIINMPDQTVRSIVSYISLKIGSDDLSIWGMTPDRIAILL